VKIQAVIFDVYSTLLEVGPAPIDAEMRWQRLFQATLQCPPRWSRLEFSAACSQVIARRHARARARGIQWPEINWPSVVVELIPELAGVSPAERDGFIHEHIQTGRTLEMSAEAATVLAWLRQRDALLGIASNSQAYTLTELEEALRSHELHLGLFSRELCFWSFEHGFSKPDPHVFQHLTQRLEARGVSPSAILMVGDRTDNDIEPARAFEWQTWQYTPTSRTSHSGSWTELLTHLQAG
jgi:FMN phosphatase YigB (HAD superfamily)